MLRDQRMDYCRDQEEDLPCSLGQRVSGDRRQKMSRQHFNRNQGGNPRPQLDPGEGRWPQGVDQHVSGRKQEVPLLVAIAHSESNSSARIDFQPPVPQASPTELTQVVREG